MQSSSLAAQVFNSYFECPWEHCKADRGTEQQLSHEQQANLVILNLWVYKHSWIQTAGQLLFALLCPQDLNRTPGTKMVLNSGWVFFYYFPIHYLITYRGKNLSLWQPTARVQTSRRFCTAVAAHPTATWTNLQTPTVPQLCLPSLHPTNPLPWEEPHPNRQPLKCAPSIN